MKKSSYTDSGVTILTSGCEFDGKLICRGASRVGGIVRGEIISEGLLIIEEEACIEANIQAEEIIVQGAVTGSIKSSRRLKLCNTSRVNGDVSAPSLIVEEAATFNGRVTMELTGAASTSTSAATEASGGRRGMTRPGAAAKVPMPEVQISRGGESRPTVDVKIS